MDVGMIGLGAMGGPMVTALVAAGHRVLAHDISARHLRAAVDHGAEPVGSGAEVGAFVPLVLLSLPSPAHVRDVVSGETGVLARAKEGLVIVDTSTVDPETSRSLAAEAATQDVGYLDAPVLGRPDLCGEWTFPVGGDAAVLKRARPVLDVLGSAVVHIGPSGSGNAAKLLNNLMFGAINAITAEVMSACEAVGVSPRTFYETVAGSGAATVSPLFRALGAKIVEGDFEPVFTVDLLHKDVSLALAMLDKEGSSLLVGNAVRDLVERARAAGLGAEDSSAIVKVCDARARAKNGAHL